jgi:hypothetical protein
MTTKEEQLIITKYDLLFESRLTRVETTIENVNQTLKEIKSDFRWIFGLMIIFSGSLLGVMGKGFHWY